MFKTKGHIPPLDGLRGLAILLVILHHFTVIEPVTAVEKTFVSITRLGGYGVDLFFVLSGFLITGILFDIKGSPHFFRNFYARRILRIFPLYYVFITMSLVLLPYLLTHIPAAADQYEALTTARDHWYWYFFYLSNFWVAIKDHFSRGGLDITWSLAIEEHFYLLWPLIVYRFHKSFIPKFCLGIIAAALICRVVMASMGMSQLQIYVVTFSRMDAIAMGAFVAAVTRLDRSGSGPLSVIGRFPSLMVSLVVLTILFLLGFINTDTFIANTLGYSLIAFIFTQLLAWTLQAKPLDTAYGILTHPFLVFLGKYSYAIYLFHLPAAASVRDLLFGPHQFQTWPGFPLLWQFVFYPLALLTAIVPALLSWNLIEQPMLKLKKFFPMERPGHFGPGS